MFGFCERRYWLSAQPALPLSAHVWVLWALWRVLPIAPTGGGWVGGYGFCGRSIQALFIVTAKKINVFNYNRRYSRVMEKLECGILVYQVSFFFYYDTHYIEQRMDFYPKSYFVRTTLPYFVGLFPYRTEQIFLLYYLLSSLCCCFFSTLLWFLVTLIRILWWIKF